MTSSQKTIKYLAIGFAVLLSFLIIGGMITAVFNIFNVYGIFGESEENGSSTAYMEETMNYNEVFTDVTSLDFVNGLGEFVVRSSDEGIFQVIGSNVTDHFTCKVENGVLTIRDERSGFRSWFDNVGITHDNRTVITVTVPHDFEASSMSITNGAGKLFLSDLKADTFRLNAGAGNIEIYRIQADSVRVEGGVGTQDFVNCNFNDLTLDCGVGTTSYSGTLSGNSRIRCGVGSVTINLTGKLEDYNINGKTGIGKISVNNSNFGSVIDMNKDAEHHILIEGGVGNMDLYIKD